MAGIIGAGITSAVSSHEAHKQRQWAEKMMKRAYQYTMQDMRKAGLNPILAYKTGPTNVGGGSMAHTPDFGSAASADVNSAKEIFRTNADVTLKNRQTDQTSANIGLLNEQAQTQTRQQDFLSAQSRETTARAIFQESQIPKAVADAEIDNTWWGKTLHQINRGSQAIRRCLRQP